MREPAVNSVPPLRREIVVGTDPATAFEVFTAHIGRWWPVADLSVHGAGAAVAFSEGRIIERAPDGAIAVWGTVTRWEPAAVVAFTWHPGQPPDRASHVEVTFTAAGAQTRVTVKHSGWQVFADPAAARAEYEHGWPLVLDRYRAQVGQPPAGPQDHTWVALLHRPGPDAPAQGTVFDDPRFAGHVAFLHRMRDAGHLIAAGPLTDTPGHGMTILRLPGANQLEQATRLATQEDSSVAGGLLTVTVRPWQVMMQASVQPTAGH